MGICCCTLPYINPDACKTCPNNSDQNIHYNQNGTIDHINTNFEIVLKKLEELKKAFNHSEPNSADKLAEDYVCGECYSKHFS
jgi:hypothetical protein